MIFCYLSIYFPKLIYVICSLIGRIFRSKSKSKITAGSIVGIILGLLCFILMWIGVIFTRHHITVNKIEIHSEKLPSSFNGYKIVHFSDMHLGTWGNDTTFISKMVDSINSLEPDLILFTGDFVNRRSDEMLPFIGPLSRLKARDGVKSVLGNHDYGNYVNWKSHEGKINNMHLLDSIIGIMDWKLLKNSTDFIIRGQDSIALIGVENWGEPPFNQIGDLKKAYPSDHQGKIDLNDNNYKILMTHNPEHWNQIVSKESNIDLSLSGHTHAMQMMTKIGNWEWSPASWRYKNWAGLYTEKANDGNTMNLYVNIGVGEVGFPARIGAAAPELTLITLHTAK